VRLLRRGDLATEIREYYIPDFSEWKNHDFYVKEFEKLLRDLRTEEVKQTVSVSGREISFAPSGAWFVYALGPTAYAVGCILLPLRG
jgi:hypothetical protein